jgi:hypothetical protein
MALHHQRTANAGIEHRRTVHGGERSALSVEVSAVRFREGSAELCNHELPERADAFSVYIRNPLAFHVEDFCVGPVGTRTPSGRDVWGTAEQTKAAAFNYADALADHLGCSVESQLAR